MDLGDPLIQTSYFTSGGVGGREFSVQKVSGVCSSEEGWFMANDASNLNSQGCSWEDQAAAPHLIYAGGDVATTWDVEKEVGEVVGIFAEVVRDRQFAHEACGAMGAETRLLSGLKSLDGDTVYDKSGNGRHASTQGHVTLTESGWAEEEMLGLDNTPSGLIFIDQPENIQISGSERGKVSQFEGKLIDCLSGLLSCFTVSV
jgi:hypothetical protein